jgi:hypothetical protein
MLSFFEHILMEFLKSMTEEEKDKLLLIILSSFEEFKKFSKPLLTVAEIQHHREFLQIDR